MRRRARLRCVAVRSPLSLLSCSVALPQLQCGPAAFRCTLKPSSSITCAFPFYRRPGSVLAGGAKLSATDAAYAPPIASVWLESPLLSGIMSGMRPCEMDADCASIPNSVCIDLEDQGAGALQVSYSSIPRFLCLRPSICATERPSAFFICPSLLSLRPSVCPSDPLSCPSAPLSVPLPACRACCPTAWPTRWP